MRLGLCTERDYAKCIEEVGPENIEWTCKQCGKRSAEEISDYTEKIFRIRNLRMAGYPIGANDLTPEEWEDLGTAEKFIQDQDRAKEQADLIKGLKEALGR